MKKLRYLDNVVTLTIDTQKCVGCGACTQVCPHTVLAMQHRKAYILDLNACMECGACAKNCPTQALAVNPGVGCASYIIQSWIVGKEKASCGPGCC